MSLSVNIHVQVGKINTPRNGSTVLGPNALSRARETPSYLHNAMAVVSASAH